MALKCKHWLLTTREELLNCISASVQIISICVFLINDNLGFAITVHAIFTSYEGAVPGLPISWESAPHWCILHPSIYSMWLIRTWQVSLLGSDTAFYNLGSNKQSEMSCYLLGLIFWLVLTYHCKIGCTVD